ncbi:zinc metalloprotease HtpX [Candidatus Magnetaquicoccus inordinatus]|uniref:zinc metalloprotease HtpX n=1 Tax=Candidatus Magnetaquicoccus inordinatus TaxID=2496818 RepID=UPI00102BF5EA|nr:zinc metalloprotease HtpX [Candidatus Magnetaquicoccus inordinatus]
MSDMRAFVLLAGLTALFAVVGQALGGKEGMVLALLVAVAMNFWAYWNSDQAVLQMFNAQEIAPQQMPEYYGIVQELARRSNMPMPRVYIIDDPSPNAFATGRDPAHAAVAATTGILRILNREELAGVMAHEMAHVYNRDILVGTISASLAGAVTLLAQFGSLFHSDREREEGGGGGGLLMALLAPVAAMLIQMAVSRSREYGADALGARLCGNPLWLASALHKLEQGSQAIPMAAAEAHPAATHLFIVNPLSAGFLAGLFSTHPPMAERIQRLQAMVNR